MNYWISLTFSNNMTYRRFIMPKLRYSLGTSNYHTSVVMNITLTIYIVHRIFFNKIKILNYLVPASLYFITLYSFSAIAS